MEGQNIRVTSPFRLVFADSFRFVLRAHHAYINIFLSFEVMKAAMARSPTRFNRSLI
jgi:hypothetical protein